MELNDRRIIEFLNKRLEGKNTSIEKFLNPSEDDFRDASLLPNIHDAVFKIENAINENKRILVYGDYDADGISASTILYLFLKSKNADVQVYIPNRFENGYGISVEAIEEIVETFAPELVVTVDLGITAIEEIEILKQEGIEVVVTDHHLPLAELPDCTIVDPKLESLYGFDDLCGAGVALKVVEAMAGREEAMKYLDICAIATIGDIVPLVDENRAIAKLGINKIISGDCLPSLKFLMKKLEINELTSSDVSFKIVPRINACGRMDNAIKVFYFLIETNEAELEKKYAQMEYDNTVRLSFIEKGNKIIQRDLEKFDFNKPAIVIKGEFHEGIIGILASRVCHEYGRPAIIFTKTADGTLKGSGRSVAKINLHEIISSMTSILENFGGHKMAIGVEIQEENFDVFCDTLNSKIFEKFSSSDLLIPEESFDIEIFEDDLNEQFFKQIELLEPFGYENEKPILAIKEGKLNAVPMSEKVFKHYNVFTQKNSKLTAFNFYDNIPILESESQKYIFIDMGYNFYKSKKNINFYARGIKITEPKFDENNEYDMMASLYNLYYSIFDFNNPQKYHIVDDIKQIIQSKLAESEFGTLIVCSNNEDYKIIYELGLENLISASVKMNGQNTILISPKQIYSLQGLNGYKNIIFMHKHFNNEHLFYSQKFDVFEAHDKVEKNINIQKGRDVFVKVYKLALAFIQTKSNDVIDFAMKISGFDKSISASQILFCLIVFLELNIFEFDESLNMMVAPKSKKMVLENSKFFGEVE